MSMINYASREINCKLVYYGPGLGGKTTNLQHVYSQMPEERKGKMVSLATETDRTLFFDFLPLDLGTIRDSRRGSTLHSPGSLLQRQPEAHSERVTGRLRRRQPDRADGANVESMQNLRPWRSTGMT
jgi:hypothetical protein